MTETPLSSYLRMLRTHKNLKQDDLAKLLGVSRAAYSHYETARVLPSTDSLRVLADYYKVPLGKLARLSGLDFCTEKSKTSIKKQDSKVLYCEFLKECSDMKPEELFKWMSIKDRELVYYYHKMTDRDKRVFMEMAKAMLSN